MVAPGHEHGQREPPTADLEHAYFQVAHLITLAGVGLFAL